MTFAEFRAWFDGYCEHVGDAPTPEQWARIKEKLAEVYTLEAVPRPVVIQPYWQQPPSQQPAPWRDPHLPPPYTVTSTTIGLNTNPTIGGTLINGDGRADHFVSGFTIHH